jgi:hypothetical protein
MKSGLIAGQFTADVLVLGQTRSVATIDHQSRHSAHT